MARRTPDSHGPETTLPARSAGRPPTPTGFSAWSAGTADELSWTARSLAVVNQWLQIGPPPPSCPCQTDRRAVGSRAEHEFFEEEL